jgi:hypothetical protein
MFTWEKHNSLRICLQYNIKNLNTVRNVIHPVKIQGDEPQPLD